jgi:hypothetical protein
MRGIPLNCSRAAFEAFEQRVEDAAFARYSRAYDGEPTDQELEDEAAYEALLDYEAGLAVAA